MREIEQAKFYTVIADEVSDVSKEQLSIAVRYVLNGTVHESFDLLRWRELLVRLLQALFCTVYKLGAYCFLTCMASAMMGPPTCQVQ